MITLDRFEAVDSSFQVVSSKKRTCDVITLCSLDGMQEHGMVFIKNGKFYKKWLARMKEGESIQNIAVVFEKAFLEGIKVQDEPSVFARVGFYATVASVDLAISRFSKLFYDEFQKRGNDQVDGRENSSVRIDPSSTIAEGVFLGKGVEVAAQATIHTGCVVLSNSKIGARTILYPNVVVYRNVTIGQDCIVHANTTIGSDGFGYNFFEGSHLKVWHFGGVLIEDSVEIGSNTSIDQGTFSPTLIGQGTKIDNQVQIAHNCQLGKGVIICGQIGFSGSVKVGDYVVMGGAAGLAPDVEIGSQARIAGMAGITGNVPEKASYAGHPARPLQEWLRSTATLRKLSARRNRDD